MIDIPFVGRRLKSRSKKMMDESQGRQVLRGAQSDRACERSVAGDVGRKDLLRIQSRRRCYQ